MRTIMSTLDFLKRGLQTVVSTAATVSDPGYDLMVIDDEATPLSAGPLAHNYYPVAVVTVIILAALTIFTIWIIRRNAIKSRLLELRAKAGAGEGRVPFTIKGIRDAIREAENNLL